MALPEKLTKLSPKRLALLVLDLQSRLDSLESSTTEPIAVIGMSCRFPMSAHSPDEYWKALCDGNDGISEVPSDRFDLGDFYDPDPSAPGKMSTKWGGFVEGIDQFDAQFFGISPREAESMDPQQRLLLQGSWEALEDAGISADDLSGTSTGVYVGMCAVDYFQRVISRDVTDVDAYWATGSSTSIAAGRISYTLGLNGPALTIDTACSSSLVAVHQACRSLRSGECDTALAGGANVILSPISYLTLSKGGMMAPDGYCKAFDASADGFVRAEGCGMVMLRRLRDARADGNRILAVIKGSAINQDGRSNGLTAPSRRAQEAVIKAALADARVSPAVVSYIEAHGTGTSLGDPIEAQALGAVLGDRHSAENPVYVGSVKTNIGHLEEAAGIAGLIKTILAIQHRKLPPSLHFDTPSPHIPWHELPLSIVTELTDWQPSAGADTLVAGVSSFGFSGTNAHIVLEEAPNEHDRTPLSQSSSHVLTLSAASQPALERLAIRYRDYLSKATLESTNELLDICYTANTGRSSLDWRAAVVGESRTELIEQLDNIVSHINPSHGLKPRKISTDSGRIAFLFTGQGAQTAGMGKDLFDHQPVFREAIERCDTVVTGALGQSLIPILYGDKSELLDDTQFTQPALFAVEFALAELWKSYGVEPDFVMGHSLGEYVAACVAGVMGLDDGLQLVVNRARLMSSLPAGGAMATVFTSEQSLRRTLGPALDRISIAAKNGPTNIVISGRSVDVDTAIQRLEQAGINTQKLRVSHAFHSSLVESICDEFESIAAKVSFNEPEIDLISNVTGDMLSASDLTAEYWARHIRLPVLFQQSIDSLIENNATCFIEIGPHPTLLSMARECAENRQDAMWLPSLRRGRQAESQLLESVAELYVSGRGIDWKALYRGLDCRRIALPTYPFEPTRHWIDESVVTRPAYTAGMSNTGVDGLEVTKELTTDEILYEIVWEDTTEENIGTAAAMLEGPMQHAAFLHEYFRKLSDRYELENVVEGMTELEIVARRFARQTLKDLGIEEDSDGKARKSIASRDKRCARLLGELERLAASCPDDDRVIGRQDRHMVTVEAEANLLERCGQRLAGVLRGDVDALEVLFPGGDASLVEQIYKESIAGQAYNELVAETIGRLVSKIDSTAKIRVLEIGAGTGSTTSSALAALPEDQTEYHFTDVSDKFLERAKELFQARRNMHYQLLNIEEDPATQQLKNHSFDIIIAANVIHATADIRQSIRHIQQLLAHDGILVLVESTAPVAWVDLTFGLTEGWWRFADTDLRPAHPLLNRKNWSRVLEECGFSEFAAIPASPAGRQKSLNQAVMVARAKQSVHLAISSQKRDTSTKWILIDSADDLSDQMAVAISLRGDTCIRRSSEVTFSTDSENTVGEFVTQALKGSNGDVGGIICVLPVVDDTKVTTCDEVEDQSRTITMGVLEVLRSTVDYGTDDSCLWIITRDAQAVVSEDKVRGYLQSLLWGLGRTIGTEHPRRWGGLIDVSGEEDSTAAEIVAEVATFRDQDEQQIAYRGNHRFIPSLQRLAVIDDNDQPTLKALIQSDASYIITGGLGAIGLATSKMLVEAGAKTLVLLGRHGSIPGKEAKEVIEHLRASEATVVTESVDVTDPQAVANLVQYCDKNLPPLRGIVHAAGALDQQVLLKQDWETFRNASGPKALGAWNLHHATINHDLDFFLLFSSVAAFWPPATAANYAAGNAFLDSFARFRTAKGLPATSINWGMWKIGMAASIGSDRRNLWTQSGLASMGDDVHLNALNYIVSAPGTNFAVLAADWRQFGERYKGRNLPHLFSGLCESVKGVQLSSTGNTTTFDDKIATIRESTGSQRQLLIIDAIREDVARILRLDPAAIELDRPLVDSGLDSLMAVELRNKMETDFGTSISVGQILDGETAGGLASKIDKELRTVKTDRNIQTSDNNINEEASVDDLSDEQVDAMLNELLSESSNRD